MKQLALDIGLASVPTLDNFYDGANEAVLQHLRLWLTVPRSPVPCYLWGDSGSGKTHLLKGLQTRLHELGADMGWMDANTTEPTAFDTRWQAVVLEDVTWYNASQQQAAFNWFVNAHTHQIAVFSSGTVPPADLQLREDLRTRLGWGHVFQLHHLSDSERQQVLQEAAQARGLSLSPEVVDFMLNRFSRDLSSLMHLLDALDAFALQTQRAVTIPLIKTMLAADN